MVKTPLFTSRSLFFVIFMSNKVQTPHYFFHFWRIFARERLPIITGKEWDHNNFLIGITIGRGNKFGQASAVRVSMTNYSINDGIYAADFADCPEKLPRPYH